MIYIVIPVYNRKKLTEQCLRCLYNQTYKEFKIVIFDDGSIDETAEMIKNKFSEVILLKGDGNLWWTGATNMGVKYALTKCKQNDYILTLNNDLCVNPDYIYQLLKCARNNPNSLIGSLAVFKDDPERVLYGGVSWDPLFAKYKLFFKHGEKIVSKLSGIREVDLLPGRGTLIPIKVFHDIGLYDRDHFPQYAADEEFSLRAKKAGYDLIVCYDAIVLSDVFKTGINWIYSKPTLKSFLRSLFNIKSANNLRARYHFARKHARNFIVYLFCDYLRLLGSFCRSYMKYLLFGKRYTQR